MSTYTDGASISGVLNFVWSFIQNLLSMVKPARSKTSSWHSLWCLRDTQAPHPTPNTPTFNPPTPPTIDHPPPPPPPPSPTHWRQSNSTQGDSCRWVWNLFPLQWWHINPEWVSMSSKTITSHKMRLCYNVLFQNLVAMTSLSLPNGSWKVLLWLTMTHQNMWMFAENGGTCGTWSAKGIWLIDI